MVYWNQIFLGFEEFSWSRGKNGHVSNVGHPLFYLIEPLLVSKIVLLESFFQKCSEIKEIEQFLLMLLLAYLKSIKH